ncbi:MAG: DNA polymerase III subunit delta' C-terminal domain-containing protein [Candidatus Omnitrophota bacterium]
MALRDIKSQEIAVKFLRAFLRQKEIRACSFLFFGPEGVGKAYAAKNFIKALNCEAQNGESCDRCASCVEIQHKVTADILWIKPETPEGSISIDAIRRVQYLMSLKAYTAKKKVFVCEHAHQLTPEAQDSLLKILEEPQRDSVFLLISSKPYLLKATMLSRCQKVRFNAINRMSVREILAGEGTLEERDLAFISDFSCGSLGEAKRYARLGIFSKKNRVLDYLLSEHAKHTFLERVERLQELYKKENSRLPEQEEMLEFKDIMRILLSFFRDVIMVKIGEKTGLINFDRVVDLERFSGVHTFDELDKKVHLLMQLEDVLSQNANEEIAFLNIFREILN